MDAAIDLERSLLERSRLVSFVRLPMDGGIDPERSLLKRPR
jgi:hypothetical protein